MRDHSTGTQLEAPLQGLRVLDLSRFVAGPVCCQILGDMGAEVIKAERPSGEDGRHHPPYYQDQSIYAMMFNRNKYGITVNTRHSEGISLLERLVAVSDVVVENYRPGTMETMGLSYERLREIKPDIILTSASGFGQTGPFRDRALFDAIAQAASGLMSLTGKRGDEPTMTGTFIADYICGFYSAIGTMLALYWRQRTGEGQHVDVASVDALFSCLGTHPSAYAMLGKNPERRGSQDQLTAPANVYQAKDGYVYLHAGTASLFPRLCKLMGQAELSEDVRFHDIPSRMANLEALEPIVRDWVAPYTCAELEAQLSGAGIPNGKVATIADAVESPQVEARNMLMDVEHPSLGTLKLPGMPVKLSESPGSVRKAPPSLGEDNEEVYAGLLGLSEEELSSLRESGTI